VWRFAVAFLEFCFWGFCVEGFGFVGVVVFGELLGLCVGWVLVWSLWFVFVWVLGVVFGWFFSNQGEKRVFCCY